MATFGKLDIGGLTTFYEGGAIAGGHYAPANGNGKADFIKAYIGGRVGAIDVTCALYVFVGAGDAGALIKATQEVNVNAPAWYQFDFAAPKPNVVHATQYFILFFTDENMDFWYDAGGAAGINCSKSDIGTYPVFPDPLVGEAASQAMRSIYCSYTPDVGGGRRLLVGVGL